MAVNKRCVEMNIGSVVGEGDMDKQQCWLMSKLPVRLHLVTIEFGETDYVKLGLC